MANKSDLPVHAALARLVDPADEVKLVVQVTSSGIGTSATSGRRWLAVLSHVESDREEGAVLILGQPGPKFVVGKIAIDGGFSYEITQRPSTPGLSLTLTAPSTRHSFVSPTGSLAPLQELITELKRLQAVGQSLSAFPAGHSHRWLAHYSLTPLSTPLATAHASSSDVSATGTLSSGPLASSPTKAGFPSVAGAGAGAAPKWLQSPSLLQRFNSVSSAYSMRSVASTAASSLRSGLGAIDWEQGRGGPVDSPDLAALEEEREREMRERWVVERMQSREAEFTEKDEIGIWLGTFNVNDKLPQDHDLSPWLEGSQGAELLVFGFQEFDLSTSAMLQYSPQREDAWRAALEKALGARAGDYTKLHSKQLVGVLILAYARNDCAHHISAVTSGSVALGLMGFFNKGAVAIRLKYKDSVLCFVNAHLAAFTNQTEARNRDFADVGRYMAFPAEGGRKDPWTPNLKPEVERVLGSYSIYDSHALFWVADANYRIELPRSDVLRMIEQGDFEMLKRFDQLRIQKDHRLAFQDFDEAPIGFSPTFKFDVGTSVYDTSEKQRVPSWTDRIQWLAIRPDAVDSAAYDAHPEVSLSDHKPVSGFLRAEVLAVIAPKRLEVLHEVQAELDAHENDSAPDVQLRPSPAVEFGPVRFLEPQTREIEVCNVGERAVAQWSFVIKPGAARIAAPWLTVAPTSGLILPGASTKVRLTVLVDSVTAAGLNFAGPDAVSDLLVLSVEKKDLFLSVTAREYHATCFGNSLAKLNRLGHVPIRKATAQELDDILAMADTDELGLEGAEPKAQVPKELKRLVNFLVEHGLDRPDLFLSPGSDGLVSLVRECLDTGDDFPIGQLLPHLAVPVAAVPAGPDDSPPAADGDRDLYASTLAAQLALSSPEVPEFTESSDIGALSLSPPHSAVESHPPVGLPPPAAAAVPGGDSSTDAAGAGVHAVADCLLRLLDSLETPVVSGAAYSRALRIEKRDDAYQLVHELPGQHASVLLYLLAFLRVLVNMIEDVPTREVRVDRLAVVFSAVLLKPDPLATPDGLPLASLPQRKKRFVSLLLTADTA